MKFTTSIALLLLAPATTALSLEETTEDVFSDGVSKGKKDAERMWKNAGSDCGNIWSFQSDVNRMKSRNYRDTGKNWRDQSFNRGARAGADQVVQKYEKRCLDSSPDECNDLGYAAASEIAFDYCPPPADAYGASRHKNYKKTCREVAYGVCEGAVGSNVQSNGCSITTSETRTLQKKCKSKVNSMTSSAVEQGEVSMTRNLRGE